MNFKSFLKTLKVVAFLSVCLCIGFVLGNAIGYLITEYLPLYAQLIIVGAMVIGLLVFLARGIADDKLKVKIINKSKHPVPAYAKPGDAGMDLRANLEIPITLYPLTRALIPTGIFIELPAGHEAQIRPRSGLAYKHGITVVNCPGTIDSQFRGEIKVLLINLSEQTFIVEDGERIAQMVVAEHETVEWETAYSLSESERSSGGFGSTGIK